MQKQNNQMTRNYNMLLHARASPCPKFDVDQPNNRTNNSRFTGAQDSSRTRSHYTNTCPQGGCPRNA